MGFRFVEFQRYTEAENLKILIMKKVVKTQNGKAEKTSTINNAEESKMELKDILDLPNSLKKFQLLAEFQAKQSAKMSNKTGSTRAKGLPRSYKWQNIMLKLFKAEEPLNIGSLLRSEQKEFGVRDSIGVPTVMKHFNTSQRTLFRNAEANKVDGGERLEDLQITEDFKTAFQQDFEKGNFKNLPEFKALENEVEELVAKLKSKDTEFNKVVEAVLNKRRDFWNETKFFTGIKFFVMTEESEVTFEHYNNAKKALENKTYSSLNSIMLIEGQNFVEAFLKLRGLC